MTTMVLEKKEHQTGNQANGILFCHQIPMQPSMGHWTAMFCFPYLKNEKI